MAYRRILLAAAMLLVMAAHAMAQSNPNWTLGFVPSPAQWNAEWGTKVDTSGGTLTGGTIAGGAFSGTITGSPTFSGGVSLTSPSISGGSMSGTITGSPTFSGAVTISGGGTITGMTISGGTMSGTIAGSPTFSGNLVFSGTSTISGWTISGGTISGTIAGSPTFSGTPVFSGLAASSFTVTPTNGTVSNTLANWTGLRVVTAAGAVTAATTDHLIEVNKTVGAATTVNMPACNSNAGLQLIIVDGKGDANINNITLTPSAGTINGASTMVMNVNRQGLTVYYDGSQCVAAP